MKRFFPLLLCVAVFAIGYALYWWKYTYLHDRLFRMAELHNEENVVKTKPPIASKQQNLSIKKKQERIQQNSGAELESRLHLNTDSTDTKKISVNPKVVGSENMLVDGQFKEKLKNWQLWHSAKTFSNSVKFINVIGKNFKTALRIENPMKKLVGVQQLVKVKSNTIYRLSGIVRSTAANNNDIIFGGRIGFYLPPQNEKQIVWMSEYNQWWAKELIFTNQVTGMATVYVHMGYGGVSSTGEGTDIRLEIVK